MSDRAYVNGFVDGAELVLLFRDEAGKLGAHRRPADWSSFHEPERLDAQPDLLRQLREANAIAAVTRERGFIRIRYRDPQDRKKVIDWLRVEHGVASYEGDVDCFRRFFADTQATVQKPRRVFLDIETDSRVPPAIARRGKARVLCWSLVDEDERVVGARVLREDSDEAERELLEALWAGLDLFDQVVAWFGDDFDFPIVKLRSNALGAKLRASERWLWMDQMVVYERMNKNAAESGDEKESLALESVCRIHLKEGKSPFDSSHTWEAWEAGGAERLRLLRYCVRDTTLLAKLERKLGHLAINDAICEVSRLFADTQSANPTSYVNAYLLRLYQQHGHRAPTRVYSDAPHEQFAGAYVLEPQETGIVKDVHVLDFSGMYPSIAITWNMSPETVDPLVPVNGPIPPNRSRAPSTRIGFRTDVQGLLALFMKEVRALRKFWLKKQAAAAPGSPEWWHAFRMSTAYKVIANSAYGVIGSPFSPFFVRAVAESIAQTGVWLIHQTMDAGDARGLRPIYGDSISADRTVVVRDNLGRTQILPVEELFQGAPLKRVSRGKEFAERSGWFALARASNGSEGWFPLKAVIRHRVNKQLFQISTKRGQTEVTEDHGIIDEIGLPVAPAEFLRTGAKFEKVAAVSPLGITRVDLFEWLRDTSFTVPFKGGFLTRTFEADAEWVYLGGWSAGRRKRQGLRRYYVAGSPEMAALMRVMGAYLSEGSASIRGITATRYLFSIAQNDVDWLERIQDDLGLITLDVTIGLMATGGGTYAIRSGAALLSCAFAALCGYKSSGKRFPSFVYDLVGQDVVELVRLLIEGDGSWDGKQFSYTTKSQRLVAGLSYVLDQRGIEHAIHYRTSKKVWTIRTRPGKERRRQVVKVEYRRPKEGEYVYDLSVEGAHTFVDGVGRVLLHNTDSSMVRGPSREQIASFVGWCNASLYPPLVAREGCVENCIEIAYEKEFERVVFVRKRGEQTAAKKKYFGVYRHYKGTASCTCDVVKDGELQPGALDVWTMTCRDCGVHHDTFPTPRGKPEIRGLEYKKGDSFKLLRNLQLECINKLMIDLSEEALDFVPIVERARTYVLEHALPVEEVTKSKSLGKPLNEYKGARKTKKDGSLTAEPEHVRVARILKQRGEMVGEGTKIAYVVTDATVTPQAVIPAADYQGECDRHHLWDSVWGASRPILEAAFPSYDWSGYDKTRPGKTWETAAKAGQGELAGVTRNPGSGRAKKSKLTDQVGLFGPPAPALSAAPAPDGPFVVEFETTGDTREDARARLRVKAVLREHPGGRAVELRFPTQGGDEVVELPLRVAVSPELIRAIEQARKSA